MKLPAVLRLAFQAGMQLDVAGLQDVSSAYVLSRGLGLSAALEIALKLKETCGIHAEAFSSAEVRHGPREIVTSGFMVIALALPGPGREDVLRVAEELKEQGARTLIIDLAALQLECDSRLGPLVALQMIYPWLARSAGFLGHDPDRPRNLKEKVVRTI
jgi:glucosamine--fructose-6-phosphate aminotransferase (isomerizing)